MDLTAQRKYFSHKAVAAICLLILGVAISASALGFWSLELKWALFSSLALIFPFILATIKNLRRFLLWLLIFSVPLNADYNFFLHPSVGGADAISIGLTDILLLLLLGLVVADGARSKETGALRFFPRISLPTLAIIGASALSMAAARDLMWSVFDIVNFVKTFLLFWVIANTLKNERDIALAVGALLAGVIAQTFFVAIQSLWGSANLARFGLGEASNLLKFEMQTANVSRPGGTIGHCNHLARYLGLLLPIAIVLLFAEKSKKLTLFAGTASLLGSVALIYTLTRSSWIALFLSTIVVIFGIFHKGLMSLRTMARIATVTFIIAGVLFSFHNVILERFTTYDAGSARTRITTAKVAWHIFEDHPILGVGINNYGTVLEKYWDSEDVFTRKAAVHNTYLLFLSETGVIGFGAFLWLLIAFFSSVRHAIRSRSRFLSAIAIGIMGSYMGYLVAALADKSYKENFTLLLIFWILAAIVEAINRLNEEYTEKVYDILQNEDLWIPEKLQGSLESVY